MATGAFATLLIPTSTDRVFKNDLERYIARPPIEMWALGLVFVISVVGLVALIGVSFALWRQVLGEKYPAIGSRPLVVAYVFLALALIATTRTLTIQGFSQEQSLFASWSLVPGRAVYTAMLSGGFALIPMGLLGVPAAAYLWRRDRFGYRAAAALTGFFVIGIALLTWIARTNSSQFTPSAFLTTVGELAFFIVPASAAFYVGLIATLRRTRI